MISCPSTGTLSRTTRPRRSSGKLLLSWQTTLDISFKLNVIQTISSQTIQSSFQRGIIEIEVDVGFDLEDELTDETSSEVMTILIGLRDIEATLALFLEVTKISTNGILNVTQHNKYCTYTFLFAIIQFELSLLIFI